MANTDFEDPVARWRREADERQAEIDAKRAQEQRERERAQRRAARPSDEYIRNLLEPRLDALADAVGQLVAEQIHDLRRELQREMQVSLRIAILEQAGLTPHVRGTWNANEAYSALDVCIFDGASWIAKHSNPGPLPGDGWQLIACRGSRGPVGERGAVGPAGPHGPRGEPAPAITGWSIDRESFTVRPILDGGRGGFGPALDLRQLFVEYERQRDEVPPPGSGKLAAAIDQRRGMAPVEVRMINGRPPGESEQ